MSSQASFALLKLTAVARSRAVSPHDYASVGAIIILSVVVVSVVALLVMAARAAGRRAIVARDSAALRALAELNDRSRAHIAGYPVLSQVFQYRAESKGKYNNFDLERFLATSVFEKEAWFEKEVLTRTRALELYTAYRTSVQRKCQELLATSNHPKVDRERYIHIERKLFDKMILACPVPAARVTAVVTYTSPKGQNSYSREVTWGFAELDNGLRSEQALVARRSSTAALRARERSLMTLTLRADILRRDGYRCRMCGAAASDGVELHIDHIVPVSRDGRTVPENLQTLCAPCNLGKGNRFIG